MTGVQAQAAKLLEQIKSMSFSAAKKKGMYLDIGKMEVLQMALEKQVPMKGKVKQYIKIHSSHKGMICARCGDEVMGFATTDGRWIKKDNYCPNCGQALDWREI